MDFSKWTKPVKETAPLGKILMTEILKNEQQTLQLLIRTENHFGRLSYNKLENTWDLDGIFSPFDRNNTHDLHYYPSRLARILEDEPELFLLIRTESGIVFSRLKVSQGNFNNYVMLLHLVFNLISTCPHKNAYL